MRGGNQICRYITAIALAGSSLVAAAPHGGNAPEAFQIELYPTVRLQRFLLPDADQPTDVGPLSDYYFAFAHEPATGELLAVDSQQGLGTLSTGDGAFTLLVTLQGLQGSPQGLATLGAPEPLFLSTYDGDTSLLYRVDRNSGQTSLVGNMPGRAFIDIAIDGFGRLYGHDIAADAIYRIDPLNAATQLVGPTGIGSDYAQGMDFDRRTGELYAWIYDSVQGNTAFSNIDLDTGQAHVLLRIDGEFEGVITAPAPRIFRDGFETAALFP